MQYCSRNKLQTDSRRREKSRAWYQYNIYWWSVDTKSSVSRHQFCNASVFSEPSQYIQYIPRNMQTGLLCFCFVVVMQSFIMNSHEVFIHIHQGCFAGTGAIVRLPQCQWSKPDGYGKISQCITTTKHSKAKTVCTFLGIYCRYRVTSVGILICKTRRSHHRFIYITRTYIFGK